MPVISRFGAWKTRYPVLQPVQIGLNSTEHTRSPPAPWGTPGSYACLHPITLSCDITNQWTTAVTLKEKKFRIKMSFIKQNQTKLGYHNKYA